MKRHFTLKSFSVWMVLIFVFSGMATLAFAGEDSQDAFRKRIEAAFEQPDKRSAVRALFYQKNLNEEMQSMLDRVLKHLLRRQKAQVTYEPVPEDAQLVAVVDGFEYRPNLEVLGYANLGNNEMGGTTKVPYGRAPGTDRYYFSATTKRLVNPDAKPDKQLQMIVIGLAHPPITFEGWCDILQSDNKTRRYKIGDGGMGSRTLIVRGQEIKSCKLKNTSGRGGLSLRLMVDQDEIFKKRIEEPETTLTYGP